MNTKLLILFFLLLSALAQAQTKSADSSENWSYHFQLTTIAQGYYSFKAAYSGNNSLNDTGQHAISVTSTLFLGRRLWKGAAFYFDPELSGGAGVSQTLGVAGFPNGETFRIGSAEPVIYVGRAYLQQQIALGGVTYKHIDGDENQLEGSAPDRSLTIIAGKFDMADFFDNNAYAHDPRSQFMNWALMNNGAWDYPANTRGYTEGLVLQYDAPEWAIRAAEALEPEQANHSAMETNLSEYHSETLEVEKKVAIKKLTGSWRLLFYHNVSGAPSYQTTINEMKKGDSTLLPIIEGLAPGTTTTGTKNGVCLSADQQLSSTIGLFLRAGWNDGLTATWAFTEIDNTAELGATIKGNCWKRPNDLIGIAGVSNGISDEHRDYLNAGGYGFLIGDGKLTNYGREDIIEAYYDAQLTASLWLTFDYQLVVNPAYNADRGPVNLFALRGHIQF